MTAVAEAVPAVVELDGLTVHLGGRPVLTDLRGSVTSRAIGLLGPNGAGKTTQLRTQLGFFQPDGGRAAVLGHDVRRESKVIRDLIGYMPEHDSLIPGMTAVRFVRLMGELSGLPASPALERAHEALFYVGLGEARYRQLDTYSTGMKQVAKLAQAIVHGPRLLILDEPTDGLDPPARRRMLDLIREIRDRGETSVLLSSHLLKDVEEICEEVLILKRGRIAACCDLEAERQANRSFVELEAQGAVDAFVAAATTLGCEAAVPGAGVVKLVLPDAVAVRELYRAAEETGAQIRRLDCKRTSLQELFLSAMEDDNGGV
jgi:ABC-2 type transport system ATP-binding protein